MNRDKHIEEMAKDLQETHAYEGCEAWHCGGCQYEKYGKNYFCSSIKQAEKMTTKGYRKSTDVAREIFEEIDDYLNLMVDFSAKQMKHYDNLNAPKSIKDYGKGELSALWDMSGFITELKKKYTEGEG